MYASNLSTHSILGKSCLAELSRLLFIAESLFEPEHEKTNNKIIGMSNLIILLL